MSTDQNGEARQGSPLPRLALKRLAGHQRFVSGAGTLSFTVDDFWAWGFSDLVSNSLRGCLAEYLVAKALGIDLHVRGEWDASDLRTAEGVAIEVKSSAYLQTWAQRRLSRPSFGVGQSVAWDPDTGIYAAEAERRRQADLYVFALLHHQVKETLNPLDLSQWTFFVISSSRLNVALGSQATIALNALKRLGPAECAFEELGTVIGNAAQEIRSTT